MPETSAEQEEDKQVDISASKLNSYLQCPAQHHWRYNVRGAEKGKQEQSSNMDAGSVVHRVLELAGRKRIGKQEKPPVTKKELLDLLEAVLKEPKRESWKDDLILTPTVATLAANTIDACWKKVSFANAIEAEKLYKANLGPIGGPPGKELKEDLHVTCILDRIDEMPDRKIKIVDYKSGFSILSRTEAELDPQINLYLAAGSKLFPGREIEIEFHYLSRSIILGPIQWTKERDEWVTAYVKAGAYRMKMWSTPGPEVPNTYCSSCYRQSECGAFQRLMKGSLKPLSRSIGENLVEYHRLTDVEKNADAAKKILKGVIHGACDKAEDGEIYESGYRGRIVFVNKTEYPDLRKTVASAAKIIHEADKNAAASAAAGPVAVPADPAALAKAFEESSKKVRLLEEEVKKAQIAFQIACAIAKAQAGLVDKWVETLPKTIGGPVAMAVDGTSSNGGYYKVEVDQIPDPFLSAESEPEKVKAETAA
jgi:RecB family exonuclease